MGGQGDGDQVSAVFEVKVIAARPAGDVASEGGGEGEGVITAAAVNIAREGVADVEGMITRPAGDVASEVAGVGDGIVAGA